MLVRGEDLDRFARVLCRLLGNGIRELFLNAAASSRGRFRVLRTWLLDRPADRLQRFPAPLRGDRGEVEFASHPSRNLAARPQPAIGGGSSRRRRNLASRSASRSLPVRRCDGASRQEPPVPRHCSGRAIVRSIARHRPSSPTLARWCDHAPKARLPECRDAVASSHPTNRSSNSSTLK